MDKERVYEYIEESGKRERMEIMDAVINRFRELHEDWELMVLTVPTGERRAETLARILERLQKESC